MWRYGEAGERWNVQPGDVWQVGPHLLACLDVETTALEHFLSLLPSVRMAYLDPPYNLAQAKAFRTKAGLANRVDWVHLQRRFLTSVQGVSGAVWIETSREGVAGWQQTFQEADAQTPQVFGITYFGTHPACLLRTGFAPLPPLPDAGPVGLDDAETPAWAIQHDTQAGDTVLDCCCGRGLTALACAKLHRNFVGCELHPRRLAAALDRLARQTGEVPTRTGTLEHGRTRR